MPLILAVEPDRKQATKIAALARPLHVELSVADSAERAIELLAERVPDLILTSQLLLPKDEAALDDRLRELDTAGSHVQTLMIPVLGTPARRSRSKGGLLTRLRKPRRKDSATDGCDPAMFAQQIAEYLERAAEERTARADRLSEVLQPPPVAPATEPPPPVEVEEAQWLVEDEPLPVVATAAAEEPPAPIQALSPTHELSPIEESARIDEPAPLEALQPLEVLQPIEARQPLEALQPIEERQPIEELRPIEELQPIEEPAPVEERAPIEVLRAANAEPSPLASDPADETWDEIVLEVVQEPSHVITAEAIDLAAFVAELESAEYSRIKTPVRKTVAAAADDQETIEPVTGHGVAPDVPPLPWAAPNAWPPLEGVSADHGADENLTEFVEALDSMDDLAAAEALNAFEPVAADIQTDEEPALEAAALESGVSLESEPSSDTELWMPLPAAAHREWPRLEGVAAETATIEPPPLAATAPAADAGQPGWLELLTAIKHDIAQLRADQAEAPAIASELSEPSGRAEKPATTDRGRKKRQKKVAPPVQDEWGFFDPEQCGFAALLAKLDEISDNEDTPIKRR